MRYRRLIHGNDQGGQSIIEAALLLPCMIVILFNALNIGYFFFVILNLTTSPRQGAEYSIQGPSSVLQSGVWPTAAAMQTMVGGGVTGAVRTTATPPYQVCTIQLGIDPTGIGTSTQIPLCTQYNSAPASAPNPDPEAPNLVLNRVDVWYQVSPLIPGALFNVVPAPNFHRYVQMRALN